MSVTSNLEFLSTLSLRRATAQWKEDKYIISNFYPRSPCGERLRHCTTYLNCSHFYPRSPCGERRDVMGKGLAEKVISIHALLAESDKILFGGALLCIVYFYPRSPCGERRNSRQATVHTWKFLSTLSLRRATSRLDVKY